MLFVKSSPTKVLKSFFFFLVPSSKPSLSAQHQPYTEEGSILQILSVVPRKKSLEEDKEEED
jgi:hypothetical protein